MPWRCGRAPPGAALYMSDNPVARYLAAVRPWRDHGMFVSFTYFLPLSPGILLRIDPWPEREDVNQRPYGPRVHQDFSAWDISFANHLATREAARFVYGHGPTVPRDCAHECLQRIDRARVAFAMRYLGFDRRPPRIALPTTPSGSQPARFG